MVLIKLGVMVNAAIRDHSLNKWLFVSSKSHMYSVAQVLGVSFNSYFLLRILCLQSQVKINGLHNLRSGDVTVLMCSLSY